MAMHCIGKDVRRRPRIERTRPLVGQIGSLYQLAKRLTR